ncbi:hypothetical protein B0H13DRAFT_2682400 [Mycena leptocephala]|nr:hypothetical protein B0H13DRAFT_2682400 [Mycena leptocephala]
MAPWQTTIEIVDAPSFSGSVLHDPQTDPTLLSEGISKENSLFFRYLRHATRAFPLGPLTDCAINDFTAFLLSMLEYDDEPKRLVHLGMELDLMMCGKRVAVNLDVVIMHNQDYILLVQCLYTHQADAEIRLIAAAIAAHHENRRRRALGFPRAAAQTYPGIVMIGTALTFYQIPVSEALVQAVNSGLDPPAATVVRKLRPPVDRVRNYLEDGMVLLANRKLILQCLGAFKQVVLGVGSLRGGWPM